jgi:uncharacterized protein
MTTNREASDMLKNRERNTKTSIGIIIIALFGFLSIQATAASFDCKKAASWVEKTICANPELSKLDEEMAKAYHDALASLSPEGQKETKQYQKQWLKEVSRKCKHDKEDDSAYCLKDDYKNRIKQLQHSLIKFPSRIFRNVYVHYSGPDKTCPYGWITNDLTYLQIENPHDDNEKFWNNYLSKQATDNFKYPGECINSNDEYSVSFSNKRLISVKRMNSTFTQDALLPRRAAAVSISWLFESKRELQTADLFDDKTGWRDKLAALAYPKLEEQMVAKEETRTINSSELIYKVTSPVEWVILPDGLGFGFFETYLEGFSVFITIDWKTLDPYLSKNGRSLIYD